jgi:hypothetical protein
LLEGGATDLVSRTDDEAACRRPAEGHDQIRRDPRGEDDPRWAL